MKLALIILCKFAESEPACNAMRGAKVRLTIPLPTARLSFVLTSFSNFSAPSLGNRLWTC